MSVISRKAGSYQTDAFEILLKETSLKSCRNKLCQFVALHILHQKQPPKKRGSSMSQVESENSMQKSSSKKSLGSISKEDKKKGEGGGTVNFFKHTATVNHCLGSTCHMRSTRKIADCIFITFDDFIKLVDLRVHSNGAGIVCIHTGIAFVVSVHVDFLLAIDECRSDQISATSGSHEAFAGQHTSGQTAT